MFLLCLGLNDCQPCSYKTEGPWFLSSLLLAWDLTEGGCSFAPPTCFVCQDSTFSFGLQSLSWQATTSASTPRLSPASPYPTIDLTDEEATPWSISSPLVELSQDSHQEDMDTTQVDVESRDGANTEYQVPLRRESILVFLLL